MDIIKKVLQKIKKLYFMYGGDEHLEHLYILPSRWIDLFKYEKFCEEIYKNFSKC